MDFAKREFLSLGLRFPQILEIFVIHFYHHEFCQCFTIAVLLRKSPCPSLALWNSSGPTMGTKCAYCNKLYNVRHVSMQELMAFRNSLRHFKTEITLKSDVQC